MHYKENENSINHFKTTTMTREEDYKLFVKQNTNRRNGKILKCYKEKYGDMPMEEAFEQHYQSICEYEKLIEKVDKLETYLLNQEIRPVYSNISESRYYHFKGLKLRFSSHVYPTGSMTDRLMNVYDLCAEPNLIDEVLEKISVEL